MDEYFNCEGEEYVEVPPEIIIAKDDCIVSKSDYYECTVIFTILGACAAFYWQALLNCLPTISEKLFSDQPELSDRLSSVFNLMILVAASIASVISPLRASIMISSIVALGAMSMATALLCQFYDQNAAGARGLTWACVIAGLTSGFVEASTFAYAVCLQPAHLAGCFSFGFGASGILSFFAWTFWSTYLFDCSTKSHFHGAAGGIQIGGIHTKGALDGISLETDSLLNDKKSIWCQQLLSLAVAGVSLAGFLRLTRLESFKQWHARASRDRKYSSAHHTPRMSTMDVLRATATCQFHLGWILFVSYAIVPNIVPIRLPDTVHQQDLLVGVFQAFDFLGRYTANVQDLKEKTLIRWSLLRLGLLGLALIMVPFAGYSQLLKSFPFHLLFVAIIAHSNGWFLTLFMMRVGAPLEHDDDKGRATSLSVITQLAGIVVGLGFSQSVKNLIK